MTRITSFFEENPQLSSLYAGMGIITLIFQIWVRSHQCTGFEACGLSFLKAGAWSTIWPISWIVYLAGIL